MLSNIYMKMATFKPPLTRPVDVCILFMLVFGLNTGTECTALLKSEEWDILILTQAWPPSVCIFLQNERQEQSACEIPKVVTTWIIHGLWPSESGTEGPNNCNSTWKFDATQIKTLRPTLDYHWPNIAFDGGEPEKSWTHEWVKHGTCGVSLSKIDDELKYFNVTLNLHLNYSLQKILSKHGVLPQEKQKISPDTVIQFIQDELDGHTPSLICVQDKDGKHYLEQVQICFNKQFELINCKPSRKITDDLIFRPEKMKSVLSDYRSDSCPASGIYYIPFNQSL